MQIQCKTSTMHLEEPPLDIGYASEEVELVDAQGKVHKLGGHTGNTQLIITLPYIDATYTQELESIAKELPKGGEHLVEACIIMANEQENPLEIEGFDFFIDKDEEFADFYGVKLTGAPYDAQLTKALILISKDGAIFYDEFSKDINDTFNTSTLARKILAAQECYTGKGCH